MSFSNSPLFPIDDGSCVKQKMRRAGWHDSDRAALFYLFSFYLFLLSSRRHLKSFVTMAIRPLELLLVWMKVSMSGFRPRLTFFASSSSSSASIQEISRPLTRPAATKVVPVPYSLLAARRLFALLPVSLSCWVVGSRSFISHGWCADAPFVCFCDETGGVGKRDRECAVLPTE